MRATTRTAVRAFVVAQAAAMACGCGAGVGDDATQGTAAAVDSRVTGVTLKTAMGGEYLSAQNNGGGAVTATATIPREWETFTFLDVNGGDLESGDDVFVQVGTGQFFQAANGGGSTLNAGSWNQLGWETFRVVREAGPGTVQRGDVIGLEATTNGTWVSAQNGGGGPVFAYGPAFGPWERLIIDWPGGGSGGGGGGGGQVGNFPARFAAPYVPTWNDTNLVDLSNATGNRYWTLAFVISNGSCTPTWNGDTSIATSAYGAYIDALRAIGGDVIVSFGGAAGTELGQACDSVESLKAAYQSVISQYHLTWIDLDIESGAESDAPSIDRRNKALSALQAANPGLRVSYTLGVDRSGLPDAQRNVLANAKANGVDVTMVNIMAMDYGPCYSDMGQAAIDAANATNGQIQSLGTASRVGVTPMIGVNDVQCEVFSTSDAAALVSFANANPFIGLLAYWSQDADSSHSYIDIVKTFH